MTNETKQEFYNRLRQEREEKNKLDEIRAVFHKRFFYRTVALVIALGVIFVNRTNPIFASVFKNKKTAFESEALIKFEADFSLNSVAKGDLLRGEEIIILNNRIGKKKPSLPIAAAASQAAIKEYLERENVAAEKKNIVSENKTVRSGIPKKISLPFLGIDADIQEVGLASGGGMGAPSSFKKVGWFKLGARPGEIGNAVLAGHLDTYSDKGGVFWNLSKARSGDYIYITDDFGKKMRFRITRSESYNVFSAPMEEIFGSIGVPRLVLITCDGAWNSEKGGYDNRLVVFADYDPE